MASTWTSVAIGVGVGAALLYGYMVWLYVRGKGRERLENGIKALLVMAENGGVLEIVSRGRGVVLVISRHDGQLNSADLRLRIPLTGWSLPLFGELKEIFSRHGFELTAMEGSTEWIGEMRILVDDIWAVGSATRGAEASNLALDAMGFAKDARFVFKYKAKKNWRMLHRA